MKRLNCKICRRLGVSVCGREKCALKRKPYPPGQKGKRRKSPPSEYGLQLKEKQKLKNFYGLKERQFEKYIRFILNKQSNLNQDIAQKLYQILESRLDNVVLRLGFGSTRQQARQLVSHGHFLVNQKKVDVPSYQVKKGDIITLRSSSLNKQFFKNLKTLLIKNKTPSWLSFDLNKMEAKVVENPSLQEFTLPVDISVIFEYYSK
jgi:small subunit ribosomal protein S4